MIIFSAFRKYSLATSHYYHTATPHLSPQTLLDFLHLSLAHKSLSLIKQCHAQLFPLGFTQNPFLSTKLISAYAICGVTTESQMLFDSVREKSLYLWNSLINGYVKNHEYNEAFSLFVQMGSFGFVPDDYTLATLSKVSGQVGDLNAGRLIHGKSIRIGFVSDVVVSNSLMSMYSKCGEFRESLKLFDEMPERNVGSWNVVITGYADSRVCDVMRHMFGFVKDMQIWGFRPDAFTISNLLPLCNEDVGRELHGFILRNELGLDSGSDIHLGCCLIDLYVRCKKVNAGRKVFEQMQSRNVYVWTALINGYVQNGELEEALVLFHEMQGRYGVEPNQVSLVSILPACSSFASLITGKQIHAYAIRKALSHHASLCNALIDMYAKCGSLNYARQIFEDSSFCRDAISWTSLISGYGLHGKGEEAISLYDNMLQLGHRPDIITVIGVLSACGKSGLVDEGLHIYNSAVNKYGIKPTVEMCACVVDMLGRSGQLDRALDFIRTMPVEPAPSVWGALLNASTIHGNSNMQDLAYRFLIQLEPQNPSNYISLSNLHALSRRWDVVADLRTMMKERGLRKTPGCSWISISNTTSYFYAADKLHPCSQLIYEMLDGLRLLMKGAGHSPDFEDVI